MKSFIGEPIGGRIFVNPGTGPVESANADDARENVKAFVLELGLIDVRIRRIRRRDYGDGRYAFRLYHGERTCDIQMPGLPLVEVHFVGASNQNAWDYPRLYVDGSSWLWMFALKCAYSALAGTDEEG